jgi:hypothetical protein
LSISLKRSVIQPVRLFTKSITRAGSAPLGAVTTSPSRAVIFKRRFLALAEGRIS